MAIPARLLAIWRSYRALPLWVQCWVGLCLVPANLAPFFLLDTATGRAGALAMSVVVLSNVPIMLWERGMSRLLSMPHLLAWIPLCIWLAQRVYGDASMSAIETGLTWGLLIVNGISLAFDVLDTTRWLRGERQVASAAAIGSTA